MATAPMIKPQPIRATITLGTIDGVDGRVGDATIAFEDGTSATTHLFADDDVITLVSHMMSDGETFGGHVAVEDDRLVLVHIDELTDLEPLFDHDDEPTGDPVIDCLRDMDEAYGLAGSEAGAFLLTGIPGIRLLTNLVRGEDARCDFDRSREHVLIALHVPDDGVDASTVSDILWAAHYAEYAETVSFHEARRSVDLGCEPIHYDYIVQKAIRMRTLLAGHGLVPSTPGRSYHVGSMQWCGCEVRTAADGWLEVSLKIDT